jgi:hypothetical protein
MSKPTHPLLIVYAADRIQLILNTGILEQPSYVDTPEGLYTRVLQESAFVELIIHLYDLLNEASKQKKEINFKDDVIIFPAGSSEETVHNVSDAVLRVRNIVSHLKNHQQFITPAAKPKRREDTLDTLKDGEVFYHVRFNAFWGVHSYRLTPNIILESNYDDDAAFYYGPHRLYLNRHIKLAFQQAKKALGVRSIHE